MLFFACFLNHRKSILNRVQTSRNFLWIFYGPEDSRWARAAPGGAPRGAQPTRPGTPGAPRCVVPTSMASRTPSLHYKFPSIPKPFGVSPRSEVSPLQDLCIHEIQSRPHSGTLPEEGIIFGGHLHHPGGHHDEEGVVHPRG